MLSKSPYDAFNTWTEFKNYAKVQYPDYRILRFRSDNGREYDNEKLQTDFQQNGIIFEPYTLYTQHQNGASKRMIQTLTSIARTMLHEAGLDEEMWPEVLRTATYIRNRALTAAVDSKTPYEAWH